MSLGWVGSDTLAGEPPPSQRIVRTPLHVSTKMDVKCMHLALQWVMYAFTLSPLHIGKSVPIIPWIIQGFWCWESMMSMCNYVAGLHSDSIEAMLWDPLPLLNANRGRGGETPRRGQTPHPNISEFKMFLQKNSASVNKQYDPQFAWEKWRSWRQTEER